MTKEFKTNFNHSLVTFCNHPLITDSSVQEIRASKLLIDQFILEWNMDINFNGAGIETVNCSFSKLTGVYKIADEGKETEEEFNFNSAGFTFTECSAEYGSLILAVETIEIDFKTLEITVFGK